MNSKLQHYYLQQMGVQQYVERQPSSCEKLLKLEKKVASCVLCPLHASRTKTAFARGNSEAKLMIIGEAPGFNEDKQGLPFVGRAGELLNKMLFGIGLAESDVYISNVIKCRPPENRNPHRDEMVQCSNYLVEQIALVKPKVIIGLGRFAAQFLVGKSSPLKDLREQLFSYQNIPFIISYHPAYLLRNPRDKNKSYADLLQLKKLLDS